MKDKKRIALAVLGFLLFGWLMTNVAHTVSSGDRLSVLHQEEMSLEIEISKLKATIQDAETKLIKARESRASIVKERNDIINSSLRKEAPPLREASFSIDKLAYAVAMAETHDCTTGMGKSKNNCFGIMTWPNGKRIGKAYASKEESYEDFKRIWKKSYGGFPTWYMAQKWTGNRNPKDWYNNVKNYYEKEVQL